MKMPRKTFVVLVILSAGLLSLMMGFINNLSSPPIALNRPMPLVSMDEYIRGPSRALQDKQFLGPSSVRFSETTEKYPKENTDHVQAQTTKQTQFKPFKPARKEDDEISEILHMTDIQKTGKSVQARLRARKRFMALNRIPMMKPKPKPQLSLFGFNSLQLNGLDNPLFFGAQHVKARLDREIKKGEDASKYLAVASKEPPNFNVTNAALIETTKGNDAVYHVGDKIPPENARQILIATTWRSGSSFTGDIFRHYPGTYYSFEPLHYTFQHASNLEDYEPAIRLLKSLFKCQYDSTNLGYLKHVSLGKNHFLFDENFRVWQVCQRLLPGKAACFMPRLYQAVCPLFPIRLIKTVRLRVEYTAELLADPELPNLKVIVLIRDPRGTMNSRSSMDWCLKDHCANVTKVCDDLDRDLASAYDLRDKYPGRVYLIRYEDLSVDPYENVDKIFEFLDLPQNSVVDNFIKTHTKTSRIAKVMPKGQSGSKISVNPYGTYRDSKTTAFAWRKKMDINYIHHIQTNCKAPMDKAGYHLIETSEQRDDPDFPVISKTAEEVWPWEKRQ
ncbi:carbohydrate sulfotransferase 1-like [Tigriopus californicus]|uniref:carbohydrate sulfotransferase 1-like n=1 Tax=Tigriopus californicus TaxID=6832 RepID=UPI0027D9D767|nr:carbohydrate sulfotransferase 1-like [Tigriopus californicus]XP_059093760.1 carbohydrate sulfotransferase 1-like [Tigriopus californicus]